MTSSGPERSIAGISLPQWMKNKINDRYDLDQSTFSPPTEDDSFFYIRYPKTDSGQKHIQDDNHGSNYKVLNEVLENHTLPCQEFIPSAKATPRELGMKRGHLEPPLGVVKSAGTDDGFHGIGAACGHSVVAVAHQMIAGGKLLARHSPQSQDSASSYDSDNESDTPPPSHMLARRRGSKSLPASPQTSPKTLRKNPYFTNIILGSSDNIPAEQARETRQNWLLSYIRDSNSLRGSMSDLTITEETPQSLADHSNLPEPTPKIIRPKQKVSRPRPSQLREMNFWSPTSM